MYWINKLKRNKMKGETILVLFFALCFIVMAIKYRIERKRYEQCNWNRNYWLKKYKELKRKNKFNR